MNIRKDYFLYFLIIASILLMLFPALASTFDGSYTFQDSFLVLGSITGLIAFITFFWQYVLSIKSITAVFTKDVISVINLHRWLGINSILLLLLHPITLILESWINRNEFLIKFFAYTNYDFKVILGELAFILLITVWISGYLVRKNLTFRFWKLTHLLTYLVLPIVYLHANEIGIMMKSAFIGNYIIVLMFIFALICLFRLMQFLGFFSKKYIVKSINNLSKDVFQLELTPVDDSIIPLEGQFIDIKIGAISESHPFSVLFFNETTKNIFLAIKKVGKFTNKLEQIQPGKVIYANGPYGVFTNEVFDSDTKRIVLIAGGIGITPFIRLIEYVKKNYSQYKDICLFYGNRTMDEITLKKYLETMNIPNLKIVFSVTQEPLNNPYEKGRLTSLIMQKYLKYDLRQYKFFICGSENMMNGMTTELLNNGIEEENIFKEEFGW